MVNLAQARSRALHVKRMIAASPPRKDTTLAQIEAEGAEDFAFEGDAATNPYMGAEGDAWVRGYWEAADKAAQAALAQAAKEAL